MDIEPTSSPSATVVLAFMGGLLASRWNRGRTIVGRAPPSDNDEPTSGGSRVTARSRVRCPARNVVPCTSTVLRIQNAHGQAIAGRGGGGVGRDAGDGRCARGLPQ